MPDTRYSGGVAAFSYAALKGRKFQRVVIIAPSHYDSFPFSRCMTATPTSHRWGNSVDKAFAAKLFRSKALRSDYRAGTRTRREQSEHSWKFNSRFCSGRSGNFSWFQSIMGRAELRSQPRACVALAQLIASSTRSSSPVPTSRTITRTTRRPGIDQQHAARQSRRGTITISRATAVASVEACGGGPIVAAMMAAERLGANRAELLKYANSRRCNRRSLAGCGLQRFCLYKSVAKSAAAPPSR